MITIGQGGCSQSPTQVHVPIPCEGPPGTPGVFMLYQSPGDASNIQIRICKHCGLLYASGSIRGVQGDIQ